MELAFQFPDDRSMCPAITTTLTWLILIHSLPKSAKLTWGLHHETLQTIYKGVILPLLLYGASVWAEAMRFKFNRLKYSRVQRLMNIKIAKAFRTTSSKALCILAGTTPIIIRT